MEPPPLFDPEPDPASDLAELPEPLEDPLEELLDELDAPEVLDDFESDRESVR